MLLLELARFVFLVFESVYIVIIFIVFYSVLLYIAPQFNFLCQENVVLSIDDDNEVELQNAVKNASGNLFRFDAHVTEYTSYVDIATMSCSAGS